MSEKDKVLKRFINIENIINSVNEFYGYEKIKEIIYVKYTSVDGELEIQAKNRQEEFCLKFNFKEEK